MSRPVFESGVLINKHQAQNIKNQYASQYSKMDLKTASTQKWIWKLYRNINNQSSLCEHVPEKHHWDKMAEYLPQRRHVEEDQKNNQWNTQMEVDRAYPNTNITMQLALK